MVAVTWPPPIRGLAVRRAGRDTGAGLIGGVQAFRPHDERRSASGQFAALWVEDDPRMPRLRALKQVGPVQGRTEYGGAIMEQITYRDCPSNEKAPTRQAELERATASTNPGRSSASKGVETITLSENDVIRGTPLNGPMPGF